MSTTIRKGLLLSCLVAALGMGAGCNKWQPTKDVWKGTKSLWHEYVSPPASIDYDDKAELSERGQALVNGMMSTDVELERLERIMLNADKPPTRGWMQDFFARCPWIDGFAGVKADGTVLGQEAAPGREPKTLDFNAILYEDAKQNTRALRCDVQQTPHGPEVLVAAPLYDGVDFLGAVVAYFNMDTLAAHAKTPQEVVILTPQALLWPGRYDFASTPLAGIDWAEAATKSNAGTVKNANGTFAYQIRYFGNLPIVFGVVDSGSFPDGTGGTAQGLAYFPKREQLPPPPQKERTRKRPEGLGGEGLGGEEQGPTPQEEQELARQEAERKEYERQAMEERRKAFEQQRRAMMRQQQARYEQYRQQRARLMREAMLQQELPPENPEPAEPATQFEAPSPFGPRGAKPAEASRPEAPKSEAPKAETPKAEAPKAAQPATPRRGRPSPFGPRQGEASPAGDKPATLPGGRPSPFGPGAEAPKADSPKSEAPKAEAPKAEAPKADQPATLPGGRPSPFGPKE